MMLDHVVPTAALDDARAWLGTEARALLDVQAAVSAIPAPTGGESDRAKFMAAAFGRAGLRSIETDAAGNVLATWGGDAGGSPVALCAHLDTVFGPEVDVGVRRDGARLVGPGIGDNARGLAGLIAMARLLARNGWRSRHPVWLVATVGEEGVGNLRGMRHIFVERRIAARAAIALDGPGDDRIVHRALGSRRYRVGFTGPGGHSWNAFGIANPAHAAGDFVKDVADWSRAQPKGTACSVVRLGGGTGLNTIPSQTWIEVDLRSENPDALMTGDKALREHADAAGRRENARRNLGSPALTHAIELIGERPAGSTPTEHPLVRAAVEATRAIGRSPTLAAASTDANIPMALGIPSISIGAGGRGGDTHLRSEWYEDVDGALGLFRVFHLVAAVAGIEDAG